MNTVWQSTAFQTMLQVQYLVHTEVRPGRTTPAQEITNWQQRVWNFKLEMVSPHILQVKTRGPHQVPPLCCRAKRELWTKHQVHGPLPYQQLSPVCAVQTTAALWTPWRCASRSLLAGPSTYCTHSRAEPDNIKVGMESSSWSNALSHSWSPGSVCMKKSETKL